MGTEPDAFEIPDASRAAMMRWHRPGMTVRLDDPLVAWKLVEDEIRDVATPVVAAELRRQAKVLTDFATEVSDGAAVQALGIASATLVKRAWDLDPVGPDPES